MSEKKTEAHPDPEWLEMFNERVAKRGSKKELAEQLEIDPSTITRIGQGHPFSPRLLYRVSLALKIRPPTTIPLDDLQQRLMMALDRLRRVVSVEQAEEAVRQFEEHVSHVWVGVAEALQAMASAQTDPRTGREHLRAAHTAIATSLRDLGIAPRADEASQAIGKYVEGHHHREDGSDADNPAGNGEGSE